MDCCFNNYIPKSSDYKVVLKPTGKTFITGLAPSYDNTYNKLLLPHISEKEFTSTIERINELLFNYWPCCFCLTCGYTFSICTIGLSFFLPNACISEAKKKLFSELYTINSEVFNPKNLHISYKSRCSTSWLEIEILDRKTSYENSTFSEGERLSNRVGLIHSPSKFNS